MKIAYDIYKMLPTMKFMLREHSKESAIKWIENNLKTPTLQEYVILETYYND